MKLIEAVKQRKYGHTVKMANYFDEYDFALSAYIDKKIRLLEIGVQNGGSLAAWEEYFPHAEIVGVDIDPSCKQYETKRSSVLIGSQEDTLFLKTLGNADIIIDDGGHTMKQQIETFKTLFPRINDGGVYIIEDTHTSYWREFGGKKGRRYTTIRLLKSLIDTIHTYAIYSPRASVVNRIRNHFHFLTIPTTEIRSMYIAGGIAFIFKGKTEAGTKYRL